MGVGGIYSSVVYTYVRRCLRLCSYLCLCLVANNPRGVFVFVEAYLSLGLFAGNVVVLYVRQLLVHDSSLSVPFPSPSTPHHTHTHTRSHTLTHTHTQRKDSTDAPEVLDDLMVLDTDIMLWCKSLHYPRRNPPGPACARRHACIPHLF